MECRHYHCEHISSLVNLQKNEAAAGCMIRPLLRCVHRDTAEGAKDDIVDLPLHDPLPSAETYRQTNEQVAPLFLITLRPVHHALLMDFLNRGPQLINEICEEDSFC